MMKKKKKLVGFSVPLVINLEDDKLIPIINELKKETSKYGFGEGEGEKCFYPSRGSVCFLVYFDLINLV